jgi:hypothetical protein
LWLPSVYCAVTFDHYLVGTARRIADIQGPDPPLRSHGRTAERRCLPRGAAFPAIGENILTDGSRGKIPPLNTGLRMARGRPRDRR